MKISKCLEPDLALGLFTAMGIVKSEFIPAARMADIRITGNMSASVLLLMGILPIFAA